MTPNNHKNDALDAYGAIARVYDRLNAEIDYAAWADFVEACFSRYFEHKPELLLDLACGTGSMTLELARRGYDMIGVDGSPDMLSVAYERAAERECEGALFLLQDMRTFELYGTVGAVTCCLDSINYLLREEDVARTFSCVHNYLDPDGLFLFDVNSPYKFEHVYGDNAYVLEDELTDEDGNAQAVFCGWQNHYDATTGLCTFDLSLFEEREDGGYDRSDEEQCERCYSREQLQELLTQTGFEVLGCFGAWDFSEPQENCERYYFVARAKK
ncbi:MAG: methyltransferase domain-containing protein [Ruminococcaceae bacterium]|nr:methyltransferase domain-containing protein [Oscillospiraceae bacterium]